MNTIKNIERTNELVTYYEEGQESFTIFRTEEGKPTKIVSYLGKWANRVSNFTYDEDGNFVGIKGDVQTEYLDQWLYEAMGARAAPGTEGSNLSFLPTNTSVIIRSDTGTDVAIGGATETVAGVLLPSDKTKLNGIAVGATANSADADLRNRLTHVGTQESTTISMPSGRLLGRTTALPGSAESIAVGPGLKLFSGVLSGIPQGIEVTTSRTIERADLENVLDVSGAATLTIPDDTVLGISATDRVAVSAFQMSEGAVVWDGNGVTLRGATPVPEQYQFTGLVHVGANLWVYKGSSGTGSTTDLSTNAFVMNGYADDYFADDAGQPTDLSANSFVVNGYADDYFADDTPDMSANTFVVDGYVDNYIA